MTGHFDISNVALDPIFLVLLGFGVGLLGGFFGVGGSFIAGPALFLAGLPMNFVVGTDLAHIAGKSVIAARRHWTLGNVDVKLGLIMTAGTVAGVELGAQTIEHFKGLAEVDLAVSLAFIMIMGAISSFMLCEGLMSVGRMKQERAEGLIPEEGSAFSKVAERVQRLRWGPLISLPRSGIEQISLLAVVAVSCVGGVCSGFLGGGAGYIRMPMMVYVLGVPTHVAVGTDLFEIIVSAGYGTFTHSLKGNVDVPIALIMMTGAAVGARIGATWTQYVRGPWLRLSFVPLPVIGALMIIYKLLRH